MHDQRRLYRMKARYDVIVTPPLDKHLGIVTILTRK